MILIRCIIENISDEITRPVKQSVNKSIVLLILRSIRNPLPPWTKVRVYSSMVFTHSQPPPRFSFHRLTLLSLWLTARTFPLKLQLTLHRTASKSSVVLIHSLGLFGSEVQILTVLSCDADAM